MNATRFLLAFIATMKLLTLTACPDPMELIPEDHAQLMLWFEKAAGITERDVAAVCGMVQNEGGNCVPRERMQLVWCVLNRLDDPRTAYCGDTLYEQIAYPGQFMSWYVTASYTAEVRADVEDVISRYILRYKCGYGDIERELPEGYCWYTGDLVSHNYFRDHY